MKFFLFLLLFFIVFDLRAQQFSQYQTGTLFDSFENPAQRAFIPDSSRQFASNFFIPNFGGSGSFIGNGQQSLRSLINTGKYDSSQLTFGLNNRNNFNASFNTYWFMLKMYDRLADDREIGISAQTKVESHGSFSDETLLLLDSYKNFDNGTENRDLFNDNARAQAYHQLSITLRQKIAPNIAFGLKLSGLLGIYYNDINLTHSGFLVDNNGTQASIFLQGKYLSSYANRFSKRDLIGYRNPGAAISFGLQAQLENGILLQGNVKDLGFIRWNKNAVTYQFNDSESVERISTTRDNDSRILTEVDSLTGRNGSQHAFYTPIDGKAEASISKKFSFFTEGFYYTPIILISKPLFYSDLNTAFINHFNYKSLWFTALATYNNQQIWNLGTQLMIKSPNTEFYIGTEQLTRSTKFFDQNYTPKTSGFQAFLGFSTKFGQKIEHPEAATYIPMGDEKGFFKRAWLRIFRKPRYY